MVFYRLLIGILLSISRNLSELDVEAFNTILSAMANEIYSQEHADMFTKFINLLNEAEFKVPEGVLETVEGNLAWYKTHGTEVERYLVEH